MSVRSGWPLEEGAGVSEAGASPVRRERRKDDSAPGTAAIRESRTRPVGPEMHRWRRGPAARPDRVGRRRQVVERGGTTTHHPERIGDKGQRGIVRPSVWTNPDALGWQNAAYATTRIGRR